LGVLLLTLCKKEIDDSLNISREISRLKNLKEPYSIRTLNYKQFLIDLVPIIQKMTEKSVNKRYKNIREVVEDINRIFVRDYRSHRQEQLEKLNFNTKNVGRDYEINNVINAYNSMVNEGANEKYIIVHGEYGIGKTKLLKELKHLFVLRNVNVYSDFTLENSNVRPRSAPFRVF
jgi:predicted ATP-dependent serine protease